MKIREALISDIEAMHKVRMSVKENVLITQSLVTEEMYRLHLTECGKGWVCEVDDIVVGFTIIDKVKSNLWALFVHPGFEKKGIGRQLHDTMIGWAFTNGIDHISLSTDPGTRAEKFYEAAGWSRGRLLENGEVEFVMRKNESCSRVNSKKGSSIEGGVQ